MWTPVPNNAKICRDAIMGVYLLPDEDVDWIWSSDGTYVIGYQIKERKMNTERDMFLREKLNTGLFIDFKTWAAFGILWEWAITQDWWDRFKNNHMVHIKHYSSCFEPAFKDEIINPDKFADVIYGFLKEKI